MKPRGKSPLYKPNGLSPQIKPGFFSKPSELTKLNKQKSFKVEEVHTPNLFDTKVPPPKLQKSYSASKLVISNRDSLQKLPKPQNKYDQFTELSQKLVKELIDFQVYAEQSQSNEIEDWAKGLIDKLNNVKNTIEDNTCDSEIVTGIQSDILAQLQKELNTEKKERYRIEEEATNLITQQEIEIEKLEKQLKAYEENN